MRARHWGRRPDLFQRVPHERVLLHIPDAARQQGCVRRARGLGYVSTRATGVSACTNERVLKDHGRLGQDQRTGIQGRVWAGTNERECKGFPYLMRPPACLR